MMFLKVFLNRNFTHLCYRKGVVYNGANEFTMMQWCVFPLLLSTVKQSWVNQKDSLNTPHACVCVLSLTEVFEVKFKGDELIKLEIKSVASPLSKQSANSLSSATATFFSLCHVGFCDFSRRIREPSSASRTRSSDVNFSTGPASAISSEKPSLGTQRRLF